MKRLFVILCALSLVLCLAQGAYAAPVVVPVSSTFDTDLDGWTPNTPTSLGEISWASSGGNPDGHVRFNGFTIVPFSFIEAPEKFLGDWSHLDGVGKISYDHKIFSVEPGAFQFLSYSILLTGPGGNFRTVWSGSTPSGATDWVHIEVPLNRTDWGAPGGTWSALLSDVAFFYIRIEQVSSIHTEVSGIDNIRLTPVPGAVWLLGSGLLGLVGLRRRFRK